MIRILFLLLVLATSISGMDVTQFSPWTSEVPREVMYNIVSHYPRLNMLRCVCKHWHTLFAYTSAHTNEGYILFESPEPLIGHIDCHRLMHLFNRHNMKESLKRLLEKYSFKKDPESPPELCFPASAFSFFGNFKPYIAKSTPEIANIFVTYGVSFAHNPLSIHELAFHGMLDELKIRGRRKRLRQPNSSGLTPFLCAILGGHEPTIHFFIEKGAKAVSENSSALHIASLVGSPEIVKRICKHQGLQKETEKTILNLCEKSWSEKRDNYGKTPLSYAVLYGRTHTAQVLLEHGRNVNEMATLPSAPQAIFLFPCTLLQLACSSYQLRGDIVTLLLRYKADLELTNQYNPFPPLYIACSINNLPIVQQLITGGACVNNPYSPLHLVANYDHPRIVQLLIEAGTDPVSEYNGLAPLQLALNKGHLAVVAVLLDNVTPPKTLCNTVCSIT